MDLRPLTVPGVNSSVPGRWGDLEILAGRSVGGEGGGYRGKGRGLKMAAIYQMVGIFLGKPRYVAVKNLPANAGEADLMDLGQADPLENEMATHFSILFFF